MTELIRRLTEEEWIGISALLRAPFPPEVISWKPGMLNRAAKDKKKDATPPPAAAALAYGDFRAYQRRFDEVAPGNWECEYVPWGNDRIICRLTLYGRTLSGTGEYSEGGGRDAPEGTAAEAQAFKRAAAMFGLGRYLYALPSKWTDFDVDRSTFTPKGVQLLDDYYRAIYAKLLKQIEAARLHEQAELAKAKAAGVKYVPVIKDEVDGLEGVGGEEDSAPATPAAPPAETPAKATATPVAPAKAAPKPATPAPAPAPAAAGGNKAALIAAWDGIQDAKAWAKAQGVDEKEIALKWMEAVKACKGWSASNKPQVFGAFYDIVMNMGQGG